MAVKERDLLMTDRPCHCGGRSVQQIGTVPHTIFGKRILVHNVPHSHCSYCDTYTYNSKIKVTPLLKLAYLNGLDEIEYNEEK